MVVLAVAGGAGTAQGQGADAAGIRTERLPNGFTVIVRENPVAPVVALSLQIRVGTRWETPDTAGITNFLTAVMVKGTTRRSGGELAEAVSALGGKISASGDVDYSEIRASALARFWRDLLGLTAELALQPKLAPEEVQRERDWLLSRVQRRRDSASSRAFDDFYALLYGAHPYGLSNLGTAESLRRIDHAALVAHYRAFFRPERMVLAVSGQVSALEVLAEAARLFGRTPGGGPPADPPRRPPVPLEQRPPADLRRVAEQSAAQAQILVGGLAPDLAHADHAAVKVLATVLGGGMASRLFAELRDRRALAYSASAFYDPVREPGALVLYLGTSPENAAGAEQALLEEVRRVRAEPVGAEELGRAKAYLLGKYTMDRRTNERQAWYLAFYEIEGVGRDFPARYRRAVEAVSAADVQRAARTYLATPVTLVLRPAAPRR
jgi:predicted Zn-dependent peptidase